MLNISSMYVCAYGGYVGIIKGTKVKENDRRYMVSVQQDKQHICGGFLVHASFVMTAAHCINKGIDLTVVVGSNNIKNPKMESRIPVKYYHMHPGYNSTTLQNDIALLQLEVGLKKSKSIDWIDRPQKDADIKDKAGCSVAGWGKTSNNEPPSDVLLEANVNIVKREKCKKSWRNLTKEMMCTSTGFCQGDSGGPLVCNGKAEGIVSYNEPNKCDDPDKPNVYTRVSAHLTWINAILNNIN
ncbi:mast cell protease 1A-like [Engraulis encrasicolus]|uniref:mast cell protease 1A-like n=1 Tax=Engraulis encrasicolus TaxID=184585 RepID=UPI002FD6CA5D